jgi:hypothetical protein
MLVSVQTAVGRGLSYGVTSDVMMVNPDALSHAQRPSDTDLEDDLMVPADIPQPLKAFIVAVPGSDQYPVEKLNNLRTELLSPPFAYSLDAPSGNSLGALLSFISGQQGTDPATAARVGYAEQYSTLFTLAARIYGLPARVVVGYRLHPTSPDQRSIDVRAGDVDVWPEVNLAGVGWVTFDVTNASPVGLGAPAPPPPSADPPPPIDPGSPQLKECTAATCLRAQRARTSSSQFPWTTIIAIAVIVALAIPLTTAAIKLIRRRSRQHGQPVERIVGAWHEAADRLRGLGVDTRRSVSAREVAEETRMRFGKTAGDRTSSIADALDQALFGRVGPTEGTAADTWVNEKALATELRSHESLLARLIKFVDPRSLPSARRLRRGRRDHAPLQRPLSPL